MEHGRVACKLHWAVSRLSRAEQRAEQSMADRNGVEARSLYLIRSHTPGPATRDGRHGRPLESQSEPGVIYGRWVSCSVPGLSVIGSRIKEMAGKDECYKVEGVQSSVGSFSDPREGCQSLGIVNHVEDAFHSPHTSPLPRRLMVRTEETSPLYFITQHLKTEVCRCGRLVDCRWGIRLGADADPHTVDLWLVCSAAAAQRLRGE